MNAAKLAFEFSGDSYFSHIYPFYTPIAPFAGSIHPSRPLASSTTANLRTPDPALQGISIVHPIRAQVSPPKDPLIPAVAFMPLQMPRLGSRF